MIKKIEKNEKLLRELHWNFLALGEVKTAEEGDKMGKLIPTCGDCQSFKGEHAYKGLLGVCTDPKSRYPEKISGLINNTQSCSKHKPR